MNRMPIPETSGLREQVISGKAHLKVDTSNHLAWQVAIPLLQYLGWSAVFKDISFSSRVFQLYPALELNPIAIFTGLALLVLSGVMNEAVRMHDEQRLTI